MTAQSGRLISERYRLREQLGQGGMGVVWLAHDELLDRTVAVKEVFVAHVPPGARDTAADHTRERMLREARAAARLDHPGAVRIYDVVGEDDGDGAPWIVMEVLTGQTLKDAMHDQPLTPRRVAEIGVSLIDAVLAAHRAGILHRDIKPANVQLCEDGRVVLTDFGIASIAGDSSITHTGDILGSPAYMSPERARGQALGPESDLFSLGATLYAAVEGHAPFERDTPVATLTAVVSDVYAPCRRAGPLTPVLDGLLMKDPKLRLGADAAREKLLAISRGAEPDETSAWSPVEYEDKTQALPALGTAQPTATPPPPAEPTPAPTPAPAPRQPHRRRTAALLVAVLLLLAAGGATAGWLLSRNHGNGGKPAATTPGGPFRPGEDSVPRDWVTHTDQAGWSVATPASWSRETQNSVVRWKRPSGEPYGYIAVLPEPGSSPSDVLTTLERQFQAGHPSYRRISLATAPYRSQQLPLLTFTYTDQGTDLEASYLAVPAHGQVYILWWQTFTNGWDASQKLRATLLSTFRAPA